MKLTIKLPGGLEVEFEGDDDSFDRFTSFLGDLPGFVDSLGPVAPRPQVGPAPVAVVEDASSPIPEPGDGDTLDARSISERLEAVGAKTDIERVTVMAQAAIEAGREAIDFQTVDLLYTELGLRKPAQWKATFSNARTRGYVKNIGHGRWRPTVPGENFARGHGKQRSPAKARGAADREPQLLPPEGGTA